MLLQAKLWAKQPGNYFCISTKSLSGKWRDTWFKKSGFGDLAEFISDNMDKDIYACPHGFSDRIRQKEFAVDPCLLYADLDAANPKDLEIRPTIAIESSPGRFVGYWVTDKPVTEQLNRRLSYSIGADISGWDRTQVLRVPNTRNYKYPAEPRVKILWTDGPTYETDRLEKIVPQLKSVRSEDVNEAAGRIFKRYENKLPRWVRKELIHGKPTIGKRSEVLWKLQNELLEAGMSRDEAFDLLWVSPWNKFKDRTNGVDQLWRELDKSLEQHFEGYAAPKNSDEDPSSFNPLARPISEVEEEEIDWLIPGWLARKELTIVEGDPGLGKSYMMQMIAGAICDGKRVPSEQHYEPAQGRVAYFDTENTAGSVTKVRLEENGIVCQHNYYQEEQPFSIDDEERWQRVEEVLEDFRPTMIVFDTINIYIGGADTYRSSETQQALARFKMLGSHLNCAVVILRHLTKGNKDKALYAGQGSIAFTGVARIVLTVGTSPDDEETRVVACTKMNIGKKPRALTWRIDAMPDTLKRKNRSRFTWGEFVDLSSDEIIAAKPAKNNDKESAMKWLAETLEGGKEVEVSRIEKMAEARAISRTTLNRAADAIGVVKDVSGFGKNKVSKWHLPEKSDRPRRRSSDAPKRRER